VGGDLGTRSAESVVYPTVAFLFLQNLHDGGAIGQVPGTSLVVRPHSEHREDIAVRGRRSEVV
jgi:hypothetical protein